MEEEQSEKDRPKLQKWIFLAPTMDQNASPYVFLSLSSLVTSKYISFYKETCLLVGQSECACALSAVLTQNTHVQLDGKWIKWIRAKPQVCTFSELACDNCIPLKLHCTKQLPSS